MTPRMPARSYGGSDGSLHNMIILSLVCHLIVVTVILASVSTTSRRLTFGPIYSVQLVGSDVLSQAPQTSGGSDMADLLQTKTAPSPIILKSKIATIAPKPIRAQEDDQSHLEKALEGIRQKQRKLDGQQNRNNRQPGPAAASAPAGMSDAVINEQTNEYISAVWSRVKQNWTMPQSLMPAKDITTIVAVKITRSGALEYAGFEKRSGNSYFDDSALRAVKKSHPFPPLPSWVRDSSIEIGIRFHSAELQ